MKIARLHIRGVLVRYFPAPIHSDIWIVRCKRRLQRHTPRGKSKQSRVDIPISGAITHPHLSKSKKSGWGPMHPDREPPCILMRCKANLQVNAGGDPRPFCLDISTPQSRRMRVATISRFKPRNVLLRKISAR